MTPPPRECRHSFSRISGGTYSEYLHDRAGDNDFRVEQIIREKVNQLAKEGLFFQDLKPENIMLHEEDVFFIDLDTRYFKTSTEECLNDDVKEGFRLLMIVTLCVRMLREAQKILHDKGKVNKNHQERKKGARILSCIEFLATGAAEQTNFFIEFLKRKDLEAERKRDMEKEAFVRDLKNALKKAFADVLTCITGLIGESTIKLQGLQDMVFKHTAESMFPAVEQIRHYGKNLFAYLQRYDIGADNVEELEESITKLQSSLERESNCKAQGLSMSWFPFSTSEVKRCLINSDEP
jgi:hypothetical protein